jgi:hypothetical protein
MTTPPDDDKSQHNGAQMTSTAVLRRIRLLIPEKLDGHYVAFHRGFEEGDLTAPSLAISDMQLARAIWEFTSFRPRKVDGNQVGRNRQCMIGVQIANLFVARC